MRSLASSRLAWLVMAAVLAGALFVGSGPDGADRTSADRARSIAETIKCPVCKSQSAAESDSAAAKAIRTEVARRIDTGQTDDEIREYFAGTYGEEILLTPRSSGLVGLVWVLPVAALVGAIGGLGFALRRWRDRPVSGGPTDDDRALVAAARADRS